MKNKRVAKLPFVAAMGKTASFYVPSDKVNDSKYGRDGRKPSQRFEEFFVTHFGGFTHEQSQIKGRWVGEGGNKLFVDEHQRYEVAFAGEHKAKLFLDFLSEMCGLMEEGSIYLTYGGHSWLVSPPVAEPGPPIPAS
ncbi:MAG TPA: hypothetical protein VHY91_14620 [Pirellulales bacterium]|jgi:hypothetical protein|nr:hypothetical protein [Pirellulales bacterium]